MSGGLLHPLQLEVAGRARAFPRRDGRPGSVLGGRHGLLGGRQQGSAQRRCGRLPSTQRGPGAFLLGIDDTAQPPRLRGRQLVGEHRLDGQPGVDPGLRGVQRGGRGGLDPFGLGEDHLGDLPPQLGRDLPQPPFVVDRVRRTPCPERYAAAMRLAVQLYTLRAKLAEDVPGTLQALAEAGAEEVELAGLYDRDGRRHARRPRPGRPEGRFGARSARGLEDEPDAVLRRRRTLGVET